MKTFDRITEAQIKSRGVQALADRPNQTGQYGVAGLTAAQVKLHFDKLAMYLAEKLNCVFDALSSDEAADYIKLAIDEYASLAELVTAIGSGDLATRLLKVYPDASHKAEELQALQSVLDTFAQDISERVVQITDAADLRRAYVVGKDGSQGAVPVADEGGVTPGAIPLYDQNGNLAGNNLVARIGAEIDAMKKTLKVTLYARDGAALYEGEASFEDLLSAYATAKALSDSKITSIGLTQDRRLQIILTDGSVITSTDVISGVGSGEGGVGTPGANGLTPHIGENGNWWIGDEDTGVKAEGSGSGAVSSSLTGLSWDLDSLNHHLYSFKAFHYPVDQDNLNVDFDVRILVGGVGFRYPCNLQRPFGDASRIIFRTPRIIFEDEGNKGKVTYFLAYEKAVEGNDTERELWLEIHVLDSVDRVDEAHLNVQVHSGEVSDIELVQKDYGPYVAASGFDSLTIKSADWANKTTNLNISSRAAAPYATASGNDSRAEGEASDVGGIRNTIRGEASFGRGWENDEQGDCNSVTGCTNTMKSRAASVSGEKNNNTGNHAIQGGKGNVNKGSASLQEGEGNHNEGYSTVQVGNGLKNYGGNAAQFGHTNENHSQHTFQTGYMNTIPAGCDYASTVGTRLKAAAGYQSLYGRYSEEDARALAIWAYGDSSAGKNVFAIPTSGTPEKDYDGITLGYLTKGAFKTDVSTAVKEDTEFCAALVALVLEKLPRAEEESF